MAKVVWEPLDGSQSLLLSCPYKEVGYSGTRGPGKTTGALMDFAQLVGSGWGPEWCGIFFRRTFKELGDVIAKSLKWFPRIFPDAKYNESKYVWRFATGEFLELRYCSHPRDYWSYHGWERPWMCWEELTAWPSADCYEVMRSVNRSSAKDANGNRIPERLLSTFNPWGPGHTWIKEYWVDPAPAGQIIDGARGPRVRLSGHWSENPHLSPTYIHEMLGDPDEMRRRAWTEDDWDIAAGAYFGGVWDARVHVVPYFEPPPGWPIWRAMDWGSSAPSSTGWFTEANGETVDLANGEKLRTVAGDRFQVGELYGWSGKPNKGNGWTASQLGAAQKRHEEDATWGERVKAGPADDQIAANLPDGQTIQDQLAAHGMRFDLAEKGPGSRVAGWEDLKTRLRRSYPGDESIRIEDARALIGTDAPREKPGLFVMDNCRHTIRTLPVAPRSAKNPDDVDTDSEDHPLDMLRYAMQWKRFEIGTSTLRL